MKNALIRLATPEDHEKIKSFCLADNPDDFVPEIWPVWMSGKNTVNLVVQTEGSIIGCVYGEILSGHDAWLQGLRIYHEYQKKGLGIELITILERALKLKGAQVIYANIGMFNRASLALFYKLDWQVERQILRRRIIPPAGLEKQKKLLSREKAEALIRQYPVMASIQKTAYFKRIYFSLNSQYLDQAFKRNAIRISLNGKAYAILDFDADAEDRVLSDTYPGNKIWVTALAGELPGILQLIEDLVGEAGRLDAELVIDSMNNPEVQPFLDKLNFDKAGKEGSYVVVKKMLI